MASMLAAALMAGRGMEIERACQTIKEIHCKLLRRLRVLLRRPSENRFQVR